MMTQSGVLPKNQVARTTWHVTRQTRMFFTLTSAKRNNSLARYKAGNNVFYFDKRISRETAEKKLRSFLQSLSVLFGFNNPDEDIPTFCGLSRLGIIIMASSGVSVMESMAAVGHSILDVHSVYADQNAATREQKIMAQFGSG
jgi:hypothetical protein